MVLICLILGLAVGWMVSAAATPIYRSQASVYFSLSLSKSATDLNQGSSYTQNQMVSFAKLATSPSVLQPVIDQLQLTATPRALAGTLDVSTPPDSVIVQIAAKDASADRAAGIANAVAAELSHAVEQIGPGQVADDPLMTSRIIETAVPAAHPAEPNVRVNIIAGGLLGLLGGILLGILLDKLSPRIPGSAALAALGGSPVIGPVTPVRGPGSDLLMTAGSGGSRADQYRSARLGLQHVLPNGPTILTVAPAAPLKRPSRLVENLAAAFAEADLAVLVIDANLRSPGTDSRPGIAEILMARSAARGAVPDPEDRFMALSRQEVHAAIRESGHGYDELTAGSPTGDPGRLVASEAMDRLLQDLRLTYDIVLIKAPSLAVGPDALQLGIRSDGMVLTVRCPGGSRRSVEAAVAAIQSAGAPLAAILTTAPSRHRRAARTVNPASGTATASAPAVGAGASRRRDTAPNHDEAPKRGAAGPPAAAREHRQQATTTRR